MDSRRRPVFLTLWLLLLLASYTLGSIMNLTQALVLSGHDPERAAWSPWIRLALGVLAIVYVLGILRWKRWGFWGLCLVGLVLVGINLFSGWGFGPSLANLGGIAVLYAALHLGKDRKAWPRLQ